ncbi:response regulator transcription factor [Streptomyces sp. NPDC087422]|uniref:helix-turn-helix transcriptional regulator n=1 Tax=Streptomyces sp. NPDC087422 TaxID=3365786 RepID=UPI0038047D6A
MTVVATSAPISPTRVRIAIVSPDILAQIRQVFARKNLDVEFLRMPYVEVAVAPAAAPAVPRAEQDPRRLCAEYRLSAVAVESLPPAGQPALEVRPHAPAAPEDTAPEDTAPALSRRQHEVMALVSRGARNAEIAARLHVSEKTVKNHINRIFRSLGAESRVEAVLIWQRGQRGPWDGTDRRAVLAARPELPAVPRPERAGTP